MTKIKAVRGLLKKKKGLGTQMKGNNLKRLQNKRASVLKPVHRKGIQSEMRKIK